MTEEPEKEGKGECGGREEEGHDEELGFYVGFFNKRILQVLKTHVQMYVFKIRWWYLLPDFSMQ
jgi:hypothetical protein